jgi:hypothetical protein
MRKAMMIFAAVFLNLGLLLAQEKNVLSKEKHVKKQEKARLIVPVKVKKAFEKNSPHEKVHWTKEGNDYSASFTDKQKVKHIVIYNEDGSIIKQEQELASKKDYPEKIDEYLANKKAKEYKVWEVKERGGKKYFVQEKGKKIWFNKNGERTQKSATDKQDIHKPR